MAYVLYIDYKAGHQPDMEYKVLYTENLFDAIKEADALMTENSGVYLMRIMEECSGDRRSRTMYDTKDGKHRRIYKIEYKAILCKRNTTPESGWHLNTEDHGETEHIVRRYINIDTSGDLNLEYSEYFKLVK